LRRPMEKDIPELAQMAWEFEQYLLKVDPGLVEETPSKEVFKNVLEQGFNDPKHYMIVAEKKNDGGLVGLADFWAYPEFLHGGITGYFNNLFIREGWRGKGIGQMLFENAMAEAKGRGLVAMHIGVKAGNTKALEFYKKMGINEELVMLETRV